MVYPKPANVRRAPRALRSGGGDARGAFPRGGRHRGISASFGGFSPVRSSAVGVRRELPRGQDEVSCAASYAQREYSGFRRVKRQAGPNTRGGGGSWTHRKGATRR